ncbi:MAG: hypothetical protein ACOCZB_08050 [Spirochaetota bacterium]
MKNVTVTLPEETARWVRVWAAEQGKSVSAALSDLVEEKRQAGERRSRAVEEFQSVRPVALGPRGEAIRLARRSMTGKVFFDTNVILYSKDARDPDRQAIAERLLVDRLTSGNLVVSAQVLNEFSVNTTRKLDRGLSRADARTVC